MDIVNNNDAEQIKEQFLNDLYLQYERESELLHFKLEINQEEFQEMFNIIYKTLSLKINEKELESVCNHFLRLLFIDAKKGEIVDKNWAIDHIWYLYAGILKKELTNKYKDNILLIQESLVEKFLISENISQKFVRKIRTKNMLKW